MKSFPLSLQETENLYQAGLLKAQGLYDPSLEIIQKLMMIHPDFAPLYNQQGSLYFAKQDFEKAVFCFESAIKLMPDYGDAYYNLGLAYTRTENLLAAMDIYQKLIEVSPNHGPARFQLACLFMRQEEHQKAITHLLVNAELFPHHLETQINLATTYLKLGELSKAKWYYLNALEITPDDAQVLFNLGIIHMQTGNMKKAILFYRRAILLEPNSFEAHNNLGFALISLQDRQASFLHYREALRIQPENQAISHIIDILAQEKNLHTSPPEYIQMLFDSYADHFDLHLTQALDYQVPLLLRHLIKEEVSHKKNILDLGCGTGLCGMPFKSEAKWLTGVDLSSKMLEIAKQKNIYDELVLSDITPFLLENNNAYDLILAADVVVYSGDVSKLFSAVFNALKPQGIFLFNTEISLDEDYKMTGSGRFAHLKGYLDKLAVSNSFQIINYEMKSIRTQNKIEVRGHLYAFKKY